MLIAYRIRCLIRNNDFPKVVVIFFVSFALHFFFGGQKVFFVFCILSETTFRKSSLFFLFFALLFFSGGQEILFFSCVLVYIDHSHSISHHKPSQKFNMCDFVASTQAFVAKAVFACDHWCPYMVRHRALLCVMLKPWLHTPTKCVELCSYA